jgi:hypothetical protein
MPKLNQSHRQYETPQVTPDQLATPQYGGDAPSRDDVVRSVNARAQVRHEMKRQDLADVEVVPDSSELVGDERVGVRNWGYLAKKGLEFGVNAFYNSLPPGMDIEDQELCDIREMKMVVYDTGLGYPGDGWAVRQRGSQMPNKKDTGRKSETNYIGGGKRILNPPKVSGGGN